MKSSIWVRLGAAIVFICLLAPIVPAAAQDGFVWQSGRYFDSAVGGDIAFLSYGIPETDAVRVNASCSARENGLSLVTFEAPVSGFDGDPDILRIVGGATDRTLPGVTVIPEGEGIAGIEIELEIDDPIWRDLSRLASVFYSVGGSQFLELGLSGSSRQIGAYLNNCRSLAIADQGAPPPDTTSNLDPRWQTCETLADRRSTQSDTPVNVTFVNRSEGYRAVLWIDFDGQPVNYADLDPGQSFSIQTYLTHPWMFTDGPGNCLEMFMPQLGVREFEITAPNRYFGDE